MMQPVIPAFKTGALLTAMALLSACSADKPSGNTPPPNSDTTAAVQTVKPPDTTAYVFRYTKSGLPAPFNQLKRMAVLKLVYNSSLPIDPERVHVFNDETRMCINLGVYLTNAVYGAFYNMSATSLKAKNAAQQLCNKMGLTGEPLQTLFNRLDASINKRDTVLKVCDELVLCSDSLLNAGKRRLALANLFAGVWIESAHITWSGYKDAQLPQQKEQLMAILAIHEQGLEKLVKLYAARKTDSESEILLRELKELQAVIAAQKTKEDQTGQGIQAVSMKLNEIRSRITM